MATYIVVAVLCLILNVFLSFAGLIDYHNSDHAIDYYAYPKYDFKYEVHNPHTGDVKLHEEHRDGDKVLGQYSLVEPDGSIRLVQYHADKHSGFNAKVKKIGPNFHRVQDNSVRPVYEHQDEDDHSTHYYVQPNHHHYSRNPNNHYYVEPNHHNYNGNPHNKRSG